MTETDSTAPSVADSTELVRGVDGFLSWNFTITGEQFTSAVISWKTVDVVSIQPAFGVVSVVGGFEDRFNVTWSDSQRATLVILNVTTEHEGDFSCTANSLDGGRPKVWVRKIQVAVVGKVLRSFRTPQYFVIVVAIEIGIILSSIYN